jgi:predicted nucleic acid-binding protein
VGKEPLVVAKQTAIVLDSWAVLAYLEDEASAERVEEVMAEAHEAGVRLLMTVVNAGEVWYSVARKRSEKDADQSIRDFDDLGIKVIDVDWNLTKQAAAFKRKGRIAYADCFAAALAKRHDAPLVTGDPEFTPLQDRISILWI